MAFLPGAKGRRRLAVAALLLVAALLAVRQATIVVPHPLHDALRRGDRDAVARLLAEGVSPTTPDARGVTPILQAVLAGDAAMIATLAAAGADVGAAPEIAAAVLVERGAPLDGAATIALPPLVLAVFLGEREVADALLAAGAPVDGAVRSGETALAVAAMTGDQRLVTTLLAAGARVDRLDADGATPLLLALRGRHVDAARILLEQGAPVNRADHSGRTPLMAAVATGDVGIVRHLVAAGADVNAIDDDGLTALQLARERNQDALATLLAAAGATLAGRENSGSAAPVDVSGWNPDAPAEAASARSPERLRPLGLAFDPQRNELIWAEYDADRIRRLRLGDRPEIDTIVSADGPIGVAVDPAGARLYWTEDAVYPRRVRRLDLADGSVATLAAGRLLNRPRAVAVAPEAGLLFWGETLSGRLRRATPDGADLVDIVTSGFGVDDRDDSAEMHVLGLAATASPPRLYWTDAARDALFTAGFDGTDVRTLITGGSPVTFAAGVAVDPAANTLYWADVAGEAIRSSGIDGSGPRAVVDRAAGLLEPWGVAVDAQRRLVYWTDAARDRIGRVELETGAVAHVSLAGDGPVAFVNAGPASAAVAECAALPAEWTRRAGKLLRVCLAEVDTLVAVRRSPEDVAGAAGTCIDQLARLDPALPAGIGSPDRAVAAGCPDTDPVRLAGDAAAQAGRELGVREPRAAELLRDVRPFVVARAGGDARAAAALRWLDHVLASLAPAAAAAARTEGYLDSGQRTSFRAWLADGAAAEPVADDGFVRAGTAMQHRDNGDGTITDLATGLMWEKKCDGCGGLHDFRTALRWSPAGAAGSVAAWIEAVNREGGSGFAGYADWRVPQVKELHTLVAYGTFNPAVGDAFAGALCGLGCDDLADPACSCTDNRDYWSATTSAGSVDKALTVRFHLGLIADADKDEELPVRAVRGPVLPAAPGVPAD